MDSYRSNTPPRDPPRPIPEFRRHSPRSQECQTTASPYRSLRTKNWAASARVSYVRDANINDFNISTTGIDISVSKTFFGLLTPYTGVAMNWNHGKEVTNEVDLDNENYIGVRGIVSAEVKWKFVNLGYEIMIGDKFNNRALKIGVTF